MSGPGLRGWSASGPVLAGDEAYVRAPTVVTASDLLPPVERRRTGVPVKLALAVAAEAFLNAGRDVASLATVFSSSGADGENVHQIFEVLASAVREVSPTRFHNSVHNAAAGYWSIATQSREPSTSLCCYDASFAAGLLDAATQVQVEEKPAALIAYDHPYPEPLHTVRPLADSFGVALILAPQATSHAIAQLRVSVAAGAADGTPMVDRQLDAVRMGVPAARSLPLLAALARNAAEVIVLAYGTAMHVRIEVAPC